MASTLDLIFFQFFSKRITKFRLSFQEKPDDIKEDKRTFQIPENIFKHGKDKAVIQITLYDDSNKFENYEFNVYYGRNRAYVQTDSFLKHVYEIIFKNLKNVNITQYGKQFKELDNLENQHRERLTLINYDSNLIEINGINIDLLNIVSNNLKDNNIPFYQISVLDLETGKFIVQPIISRSEYNSQFLEGNQKLMLAFEKNFKKLLEANISDFKKIKENIDEKFKILNKYESLNLNRDDNYLDEIFNKKEFLNLPLFWNYSLIRFYFMSNQEYNYFNNDPIKRLIINIKEIKTKIIKTKDLPIYEKVRTISSLFMAFFMKKGKFSKGYEVDRLNLRYLIVSKKEKNSIIDRCYNFYNDFVDSITEDSPIFPYLLNINGGCGYYNKEIVYTFDLKNVDMIKSHLKQVFPKVIIFCYIENGEIALNDSKSGGIIINEFYLTDHKNLDYNSSQLTTITEEEKDDIAMNIFLKIIHEASGHKKFALSIDKNESPKKIFSSNNDIITLQYKYDLNQNDKNSEYILTSNTPKKGDSGHYLELCYGKYKNELIIGLLRKMKNKGKLIKYPKLFTDDIKALNEYVSIRKQMEENNINFDFKSEISMEDEIKQMKGELDKIKENKIKNLNEQISDSNELQKHNFLDQGKRKREKDEPSNDNDINSQDENNKNKKLKNYENNYLKSSINITNDEIKQDDNNNNKTEETDWEEKLKVAKQKLVEKFDIDLTSLTWELERLMETLNPSDPYFDYVLMLYRYSVIKY